jgi:UrcA family protein
MKRSGTDHPIPPRRQIMRIPIHHASRTRLSLALACVLAGTATLGSASPALGSDAMQSAPTARVSFGPRDLRTSASQAALYRRLAAAATRVCRSNGRVSLRERAAERECAAQSLARAVATVDAPAITALHASRSRPVATS